MSTITDLSRDLREGAVPAGDRIREERRVTPRAPDSHRGPFERAYGSLTGPQKMALTTLMPISMMVAIAAVGVWNIPAAAADGRYWVLGLLAVAVSVHLFFCRVVGKEILGTTTTMSVALYKICNNDIADPVPNQDRGDEYGAMARAIEKLRLNTAKLLELSDTERATREEIEAMRVQQGEKLHALAESFERTVGDVASGVAAAAQQLHTTATTVASTADRATSEGNAVSQAMAEASAGASAAAAASDEFAMSIGEISRQAANSAELARTAKKNAGDANQTIGALDDAAMQIGQVVELISNIAKRTNLLALNASIEAARGGEAGRGFAVVASEVKELASQTTRATEDVSAQIQAIQASTGNSVAALKTVTGQIEQLETTAISIASAVDQQSIAGQDLAQSIDRSARSTGDVSAHIERLQETSLATGAAASEVLNSVSELDEQASVLREQVNSFLQQVRVS